MLYADFLKAAVPSPVTCLGVRLRPLSLGSLLLLSRFENEFLLNREASLEVVELLPLGDLLQGIIVCSQKFKAAQAALSDPDLGEDVETWAVKLGFGTVRRRWWDRFYRKQTKAEKDAVFARLRQARRIFSDYLVDGMAYPCSKAEVGPEREVGSPWPALTLTGLMADLHQNFDDAVNQPLALSRWLVASNGERKGMLEIVERSEVANLQEEADAIAREVFGVRETPNQTTSPPPSPPSQDETGGA